MQPRWRGDGRELFFFAPDGSMMAADIRAMDTIEAGEPHILFKTRVAVTSNTDQYTVTADGRRFLIMNPISDRRIVPFAAILNWQSLQNK